MSKINDSTAPPPPEEPSYEVPAPKDYDEALRRLHLYEILLEEYDTHCPPDRANPKSSDDTGPQGGSGGEEGGTRQPALDRAAVDEIKREGEYNRREAEKIEDENERSEFETRKDGELASKLFTLMAEAQREKAEGEFQSKREYYDQEIKKVSSEYSDFSVAEEEWDDYIERIVEADINGDLDDLRENCRVKIASYGEGREEATKEIKEEVRRRSEREALKELHRNRRSNPPPPPDHPSKKGGDQIGAGPVSNQDNGNPCNGNSGNGDLGGGKPPGDPSLEARRASARSLRSALCLSGGGIRSATFNLGILQGLARHGLLDRFDYLSTVSGGGFIGSFLTAWMHRCGIQTVMEELKKPPLSPLDPEPNPINHLRVFSNYLSPRPGLLSADTWTLAMTAMRNLLLTWLVFVPFLVAALMVPRAWMAIVARQTIPSGEMLFWSFAIGLVLGWLALTYDGFSLSRRKSDKPPANSSPYKNHDTPFLVLCLLPTLISAAAFSVYWARRKATLDTSPSFRSFALFMVVLISLPWLLTFVYRVAESLWRRSQRSKAGDSSLPLSAEENLPLRYMLVRLLVASLLILLAQAIAGALLYALTTKVFFLSPDYPRLYATFSVPAMMAVLTFNCILIAGFTSPFTKDGDMEWWARSGAWFLIAIAGWSIAHLLVLFGPEIILRLGDAFKNIGGKGISDLEFWKSLGQVLAVAGGVISGFITLLGGFSARTPASGEEARRAGGSKRSLDTITSLLGPIFLAFIIILLSLGTNLLLVSDFANWLGGLWPGTMGIQDDLTTISPSDHEGLLKATPLRLLLTVGLFVLAAGTVMGLVINTNKFSLHYMWRDRIIRAYLGASRQRRNQHPFTGFDEDDNIYMSELRDQPDYVRRPGVIPPRRAFCEEAEVKPRKLFHILNIALNLAGGDKLAWQDRKAESFTVSPLHVGSYWLGYRRSFVYGGERGISLGTAVAISGAFVSPNMGYMMSSPIVRFLMTLFNVRFGWWLGNPGDAGYKTGVSERVLNALHRMLGARSGLPFTLKAPRLSVRPIVGEAFGMTNDTSPYVYLSDGGHFENLGLYEMVLRRCRFIVVSDASTDAGYSFDSLAQSIRQIRVDLGVPIDFRELSITTPSRDLRGKYCAVGRIRYSCVDRKAGDEAHSHMKDEDFDGTIIYIKASMIGEEPRDVLNYGQGSKSFPQETIVDQWFSEAQFESYRALGSHIIDVLCSVGLDRLNSNNQVSLPAFQRKAERHNQLDFRVFKERISYAALANQFRSILQANTPRGYRSRVERYLKEILG